MAASSSKPNPLARFAFRLCLIGFFLSGLCWALSLSKIFVWLTVIVELLALGLGLIERPHPTAKLTIAGVAVFFGLALVLALRGFPTAPLNIKPTAEWMQPLNGNWVSQSAARPHSLQIDPFFKKDGADSLRFELQPHDAWVGRTFGRTFRTDVATQDFAPLDTVRWYSFSVCFAANTPIEDKRVVFAQWHQKSQGAPGANPPLAFHFANGKLRIALCHTGGRQELFEKSGFSLGGWHDFVVQAKWSATAAGTVNVWWNNQPIIEHRGPVGYQQKRGPQFNFGLYREASDKTYAAWFSQVKSGSTAQEVGFDPALIH